MDPIGVAAASGMRARMESLEILANNLANSTTAGFKADREAYGLFVGPEAYNNGAPPLTVPVTERNWTDHTQGPLQATGKSTDLAISGRGFFVLGGRANPSYSRAGSFRVAPNGVLESGDGRPVLDTLNRPIQLAANSDLHITAAGEVHQNGAAVAQLKVVEFPRTEALTKEGSSTFALPADAAAADQPTVARQYQVYQGYLEAPNVHAAESAVRMIHVLRQFESLQRAMTMTSEMNQKVLDEVVKSHG
jgi:flagellar basal-body rod protein FlgF